jgi:F-type H+-transporting ATPase subunit b
MFLALDLGETVNSAIENGIDLIENGSLNPNNIDVALLTLIAQLLATTVLFLVVRFKFWHIVTNIIESRQNAVQEQLDKAEAAKVSVEQAQIVAKDEINNARVTANNIIQQARVVSEAERVKMLEEAKEQIEAEKAKALNEISQNEKELRKNIQQEIVDVAYMLADKMVNKQMDEKANQAVVDEFLNNDGNFKC